MWKWRATKVIKKCNGSWLFVKADGQLMAGAVCISHMQAVAHVYYENQ